MMVQLKDLPLVLCGPILRRVTKDSATVMVVLKAPREVIFEVYGGPHDQEILARAVQPTSPLGEHLHYALVTARFKPGAVAPGRAYLYDLSFGSGGAGVQRLLDDGVLVPGEAQGAPRLDVLLYHDQKRPSLVIPPDEPERLRVLHGSCRKPHGQGPDALALADEEVLRGIPQGPSLPPKGARPHMLLLTGDQIYADDVHPALLWGIHQAMQALLGSARFEQAQAGLPKPGADRTAFVRNLAELSSGHAKHHLASWPEFCGMYLLAWSPALWGFVIQHPDLKAFRDALPRVRRALAHVPTYTIFDDHEITDDWFISEGWTRRVLASAQGRRILRNGLAAYLLFQHAGNAPDELAPGTVGAEALGLALAHQDPSPPPSEPTRLDKLLGLVKSGQPLSTGEPGVDRVDWHWSLSTDKWELVALDTRMRRVFAQSQTSLSPLEDLRRWLPAVSTPKLTLLLSAAPVLGLKTVERVQGLARALKLGEQVDSEAWGISPNYKDFLTILLTRRAVVALSGDVHYGFSALLKPKTGPDPAARVLAFTSSALKNEPSAPLKLALSALSGDDLLAAKSYGPLSATPSLAEPQEYALTLQGEVWVLEEILLHDEGSAPQADPENAHEASNPQLQPKSLFSDGPLPHTSQHRAVLVPTSNLGAVSFERAADLTHHDLLSHDPKKARRDSVKLGLWDKDGG